MSKYVKELMMDQLRSDLDGSQSLLIVDLKDLDAIAEHGFRRDLRKKAIRLRVLKNSLARRVFSDMGMDGLSKYLQGPSAVVWGGDGPSELAKEITTQFKTLKKPKIKGGAVDGVVVGPEQVDDITKLPSREVLIGQVLSLLLGPAQQTLSLLTSSASTVVGQLEALAKRGGEDATNEPAASPDEPAAAPNEPAAAPNEPAAAPNEPAVSPNEPAPSPPEAP
jgi:large subunit ribosomal protein L10